MPKTPAVQTPAVSTIRVVDFHEAALLRSMKVPLVELVPFCGRLAFDFDNAAGQAAALLHQHRTGGVPVNSFEYTLNLTAVKDLVFRMRRAEGGLDR